MFFLERLIHRLAPTYVIQNDSPPELSDDGVLLKVLTHADNEAYYQLYTDIDNHASVPLISIRQSETAAYFTKRIVSSCEMLWTIRLADTPNLVIGDCALHHWNRDTSEIEIGGSLTPAYWGSGIMAAAFLLVTEFAKTTYNIKALRCTTSPSNRNACRFAEKMGFDSYQLANDEIHFRKIV